MKKTLVQIVLLASIGTGLVGCSTNTQSKNTGIGAVTGAAVGGVASGLLGGNPVAVGVSAVAGALIGGYIGHSMDHSDSAKMDTVMNDNATSQTTTWTNSKTGASYKMTPKSGMMTVNGNPNCRKYMTVGTMNGKKQTVHGVACRQADGSWKAVNS